MGLGYGARVRIRVRVRLRVRVEERKVVRVEDGQHGVEQQQQHVGVLRD